MWQAFFVVAAFFLMFHKSNANFSRYNFRSSDDVHKALYQTHYSKDKWPSSSENIQVLKIGHWVMILDTALQGKSVYNFQAFLEVLLSRLGSLALAILPHKQSNLQDENLILFHPSPIHPSLTFPLIINSNMLTVNSIMYRLPII